MKGFAALYTALDETTATNEKVAALRSLLLERPRRRMRPGRCTFSAAGRPKRLIAARNLRAWAMEEAGIPEWLFEESYQAVGDLAETITLLLPGRQLAQRPAAVVLGRGAAAPAARRGRRRAAGGDGAAPGASWTGVERFVWNKLITGRIPRRGVATLVIRALAEVSGLEEGVIAHRLMGDWEPTPEFFERLVAADTRDADISRPYPFFLAYPLEAGARQRSATRRVAGGMEMGRHPRAAHPAERPDLSLVPRRGADDGPLSGDGGGRRAAAGRHRDRRRDAAVEGRSAAALRPAAAADRPQGRWAGRSWAKCRWCSSPTTCWSTSGEDVREPPLRAPATPGSDAAVVPRQTALMLSPVVHGASWDELAPRARTRASRGRGPDAEATRVPYGVGRRRGDWWKWKVRSPHRSTRCSSTRRPAAADAPASSPTTPSASGKGITWCRLPRPTRD